MQLSVPAMKLEQSVDSERNLEPNLNLLVRCVLDRIDVVAVAYRMRLPQQSPWVARASTRGAVRRRLITGGALIRR